MVWLTLPIKESTFFHYHLFLYILFISIHLFSLTFLPGSLINFTSIHIQRPLLLVKWPTWRTVLFYVFIYIFNSLSVSSTSCSSSGETNCVNTTCGSCHSVSVAVSCAGRKSVHDTATDTKGQLPEVLLTQFVSPDDEHDVLETCRELKI